MKKLYLLAICFMFVIPFWAQSTETFEDESTGSTSFSNNGRVFNITSQAQGPFDIYYNAGNYGWNGAGSDARFIDNSGGAVFNTPVQFTISAAGGVGFTLKSFYVYLAKHDVSLNVTGSLVVTGKLQGVTKFSATANSPFNTNAGVNNGFTFINMSVFGGQNNSNITIDEFVISTTGNIAYVALDAMTWQCPSVALSQAAKTNVSCFGGNNGTATVSATGGNGFTYDWTPGSPIGDGTATVAGLTAGNWTVTVTNSCGISNSTVFTITQPASALSATQSQTNVSCNSGSNGSASVVASGGTAPYTYSWSPSGGSAATASNLAAGNYTVTITDVNGCTLQKAFTITQPVLLSATQSQTNVSCNSGSNGSASVVAAGGTAPYTYSWSPSGGSAATASNLAAGNYTVTVTDANGCALQKNFTITQPVLLSATQSQTNVSCNSGSNGSASVVAAGGTAPYTYSWSPSGGSAATASNLAAGNYTVTITDANSCALQKNFTITQPILLSATQSQANISCNGGNNGSASVVASGGTAPYTYSWSPSGGSAATASNLSAGNYTATITDANGCALQKNFTITQLVLLSATQSQNNVSCNGGNNGSATVAASGGAAPYTYSWSPSGGNAATASNLATGNYIVTITDANGCTLQKQFTITNASECSVSTVWNGNSWSNGAPECNSYNVTINGDYDSSVDGEIIACTLTVTGGTVIVAGGDNFIIKGVVTVSGGSLTFKQNSNLLQVDDVNNVGVITYERNSSALYNYDYTIWSSPVSGTQTLKDFSPGTLDANFMVYNTALNAYSNYLSGSGIFGGNPDTVTFATAKGYLIRMPDGLPPNVTSVFNGEFTGTPNNGDLSIALNTQANRFNAVGNPYPSPINVQDFLLYNQANLDNGTLYFWRKRNGSPGTTYATVTLAGYIASTAEGGDTSAGAFNEGDEANWVINPAQGFLVKAKAGATALNFTNSMRRAVNNNQFFRMNGNENTMPPLTGPTSKIWLNITSEGDQFGQTAIAYTDVTTNGLDYGYDGKLFNDGSLAIYSLESDTRLAIQARQQFAMTDEVPLGYRTSETGRFTISTYRLTGVFNEGQEIYLRDNTLGLIHDFAAAGDYIFLSEAGTFNDRFDIIYINTLSTNANFIAAGNISISNKDGRISIIGRSCVIQDVNVYDLHGRLIYKLNNVNATETLISDLLAEQQMLIVSVVTTEGERIAKKIIF